MDTKTVNQNEVVVMPRVVAELRPNGRLWESFPEPRGWAVHWDGFELDRSATPNGHNTYYPVEPEGR
jgi:hypothetical protein